MDRLLIALGLALLLMLVPMRAGTECGVPVQAVFFSMLFPQLAPGGCEATPGEAVAL